MSGSELNIPCAAAWLVRKNPNRGQAVPGTTPGVSGKPRIAIDAERGFIQVLDDRGHSTVHIHKSGSIEIGRDSKPSVVVGRGHGRISLCDRDGNERVRIDGETGQIRIKQESLVPNPVAPSEDQQWLDLVEELQNLRREVRELKRQL